MDTAPRGPGRCSWRGRITYTQLAVGRLEAARKMSDWRNQHLPRSCHQFYSLFPLPLLVRKYKTKEIDSLQAVTPTGQPSSGERRYSAVGLRTAWLASLLPTVSLLPGSPPLGPPRRGAEMPAVPPACGAASPSPSPVVTASPVRAERGPLALQGGCRRAWRDGAGGAGGAGGLADGRGEQPRTLGTSPPTAASRLGLALLNSDNTLEKEKRPV